MGFALCITLLKRRLLIWPDHSEPCSWLVVNGRAVLSPLAPLSINPDLNIYIINLPKLHPKWERPNRYFTENSSLLPLLIQRRYRQRYHGVEQKDDSFRVQYKVDFPVLYVFTETLGMTMEEMEEMERGKWEREEDLMQELKDLEPQKCCGSV
jgi:hypothetical protein